MYSSHPNGRGDKVTRGYKTIRIKMPRAENHKTWYRYTLRAYHVHHISISFVCPSRVAQYHQSPSIPPSH